ncbi:MAG: Fpg/Nei family DNA glycosylase [Candidatus Wenzhouxiangella sp. M2_3B_020]
MPELPDAEVFKQYFDATALHKPVRHVSVGDDRVLDEVSPQQLGRALKDRSFGGSRRHGKYLFAEVDSGEVLAIHFGMTGSLSHSGPGGDEPENTRVRFDFDDGGFLAFVCPRMFGRVSLCDGIDRFLEAHDIGPDALTLTREEFREVVGGSTAMSKSALMDQARLAGIGNIYSDEILFQARIHPRTEASRLSESQLDRLFECMRKILQGAIDMRADPARMPDDWLVNHRREGDGCPICGKAIEALETGSRNGYYCPSHQAER